MSERATPWTLPTDRLEEQFADKKPRFDRGEATAEANRCLYCYDAPCIQACPTSIDIPTFIRKIGTENLRGSARTILEANLLGSSCSTVCPVEELCEGACVYVGWGRKPIQIGRLQRYALDAARSRDLLPTAPASGKSVGLVGGGPASLACAGTLARLGHSTVIYERDPWPGGLNTTGVAPYKLAAESSLSEVDFIRGWGVQIETGVNVGVDVTPQELLGRHDALFLGLGLGHDSLRGVPGTELDGVIGAVAWIRKMKLDPTARVDQIQHAVVVGGGNTALDVVQELAGLGVPNVTLVYRKNADAMSGYDHEAEGARGGGVRFLFSATVSAVRGHDRVEAVEVTAGGESPRDLPCDLLVVATGQEKLVAVATQFPDVTCDERGNIVADTDTLATQNPRIFTGGDCYNGGKEVVNAADEGQRAARAIHELLSGEAS